MHHAAPFPAPGTVGIELRARAGVALDQERQRFEARLAQLGLHDAVASSALPVPAEGWRLTLTADAAARLTPGGDTTALCQTMALDPDRDDDLEREILVALLASPVAFGFPSFAEIESHVRVRMNIVRAGHRTALAFDTEHAERPSEYWSYTEQTGFTLRAGRSLIDALKTTTQPDVSGKLYSFSCYRATEYVILLAVAQELERTNPAVLARLEAQWEIRAILSGEFHDVFLREYGSMQHPLPARYYVPGDRLWFRNPDPRSSDVEGYEGSWVFYLGNGLFTNFWKRDKPFTLTSKCVELFHWRHAARRTDAGKLTIDEAEVERRVEQTLQNPEETERVLARMLRWRDPSGVYAEGGCIDSTRECVRLLRPGTGELVFPNASGADASDAQEGHARRRSA